MVELMIILWQIVRFFCNLAPELQNCLSSNPEAASQTGDDQLDVLDLHGYMWWSQIWGLWTLACLRLGGKKLIGTPDDQLWTRPWSRWVCRERKKKKLHSIPPQNDHGIVHLSCMLVSAIWTSKIFFHLAQVVYIVADSVVESTATITNDTLYKRYWPSQYQRVYIILSQMSYYVVFQALYGFMFYGRNVSWFLFSVCPLYCTNCSVAWHILECVNEWVSE